MSTLDIIYIGIMVVSLSVSALRGGVRELFSLAAVIVGFIAASHFYRFGSGQLLRLTSHENINDAISFILIFLFIALLISYVGGQLTHIVKKSNLGFWNLMTGTAIGLVKGLFVCALLTYVLLVFMKPDGGFFSGSKGFPIMSQLTVAVSPIGPKNFRHELDKKLDELYGKGAEAATLPSGAESAPKRASADKKAGQAGKADMAGEKVR